MIPLLLLLMSSALFSSIYDYNYSRIISSSELVISSALLLSIHDYNYSRIISSSELVVLGSRVFIATRVLYFPYIYLAR